MLSTRSGACGLHHSPATVVRHLSLRTRDFGKGQRGLTRFDVQDFKVYLEGATLTVAEEDERRDNRFERDLAD
jgi:hypothetical protein